MKAPPRPNVLLIQTDQQRFDTLGANGNPLIRTPNLDALAREGVNFSRAYVTTPVCVSSRVALWTGRYNCANGSTSNQLLLQDRETDFAALHRQHGYFTALVGKDHCFNTKRLAAGFDHVCAADHWGFHKADTETRKRMVESRRDQMLAPFARDPIPAGENLTASLFKEAENAIGRRGDQPFLLWLSIPDPHPPYMVSEPWASMYDGVRLPPPAWAPGEMRNKPYRQRLIVEWDRYGHDYPGDDLDRLRRTYWGMVSCIDDGVGSLMRYLEARGLAQDTIVVFTSDHGDYMGDHHMIRKGPHVYEALAHVPLIFRWGNRFPAHPAPAFVANIDLFPTLCEFTGVPVPPQAQGASFDGVLRGEKDRAREMIFLEHGEPGSPLIRPGDLTPARHAELKADPMQHFSPEVCRGRTRAVRTERWKFCENPGDVDELYDLENDPNELRNLADQPAFAPVVREHRAHLRKWEAEVEASLPG